MGQRPDAQGDAPPIVAAGHPRSAHADEAVGEPWCAENTENLRVSRGDLHWGQRAPLAPEATSNSKACPQLRQSYS
jgi:hypothetical protein